MSTEMLLVIDPASLQITAASPKLIGNLGYPLDELIGSLITEFDFGLAASVFWEGVQNGEKGEVESVEGSFLCNEGELPISKTIRRVTEDGHDWLIIRIDDESDIKRAEDNLIQYSSQLKATLEAAGDGILVVDTDGNIVNMNRRFSSMWDIPQAVLDAGGETIMVWLSEQLLNPSRFAGKAEGERFETLELNNGKVFECRSFQQVIKETTIGRVLSFHDITLRVQKEHELIEERQKAEQISKAKSESLSKMSRERKQAEVRLKQAATVFENVTDGVIITDANGAIVTINHAAAEITGYRKEEVVGKQPNILKSDRHGPWFFKSMWRTLKKTNQWRGEIWNRRKNGEVFPCWLTISAVRDDDTEEIKHYVSMMSDITAIKESQERLQHMAHHDPLTNLPNRLLFNARLEHAIDRAHREKSGIGVMFLDLDNFKPINDGLGHPVGDKALQLVAKRLVDLLRGEDTVARIAGDEFAIIMEEITDSQGISRVAGEILSAFEVPFRIDGQELHLTTSIGISLYPNDGKEVTVLVKNSDTAMYRAKRSGKNRCCFYTQDLTEAALIRLQLENDLRGALRQNEFQVYYQPQYSLSTKELTGAEALVRWHHPEMGLVSPIRFIPIAESIGIIIPLGEWVLREACTKMKMWQESGFTLNRISVNVAGQQIQRSDFVKTARKSLADSGLDPQHLELEITESFIMEREDEAISTLGKLRDLGVTLAIDDFGTGYSSLSYLKRLPIDKLKIDRSFIKDIPQDTNGEAIARAVIALGKSMQLKIIAEGVETEEQMRFVCTEGCDEVQGYYYSRPLSEKDFIELLKSSRAN
ncbi:MAG: EAL domain-containing protein [Gammaproteobacteria bacterium]|nr:EAL domain-containing protein [Gammaproteobacteria bacterium]